MIALPKTILVATEPVNFHLSFDRLAAIVREQLGGDPKASTVVVFHDRRRTHVKLLWHDGSGYCVLYKRLRGVNGHPPEQAPRPVTALSPLRERESSQRRHRWAHRGSLRAAP